MGPSPGKKLRVEGVSFAPSEDGVQASKEESQVAAVRASSSSSSQDRSTPLQTPSLSSFAQLHATLNSPEAISSYLEDTHRKELMFTDVKTLQTFIAAALSGRPDAMWEEWITHYKADVYDILFALYCLATTPRNKASSSTRAGKGGQSFVLRPSSHEFLIQLERHGVRRSAWEASLHAPPYNIDTSLLSPKAMLKQLAALDPFPRLQRWIEMSHTVEALCQCGEKMKTFWMEERATHSPQEEEPTPPGGDEAREKGTVKRNESVPSTAKNRPRRLAKKGSSVEEGDEGGYESWCALLSKWISKMRRVADRSVTTAAAHDTQEEKEGEEEEEKERKSDAGTEGMVTSTRDSLERDGAKGDQRCQSEQHEQRTIDDGEAEKEEEPVEGEPKSRPPQHTSWSEEEREQMRDCIAVATELLGYIMDAYQQKGEGGLHLSAHLRCPTGKTLRYAEWASPLGLIRENDVATLHALDEIAKQSLSQVASQMEIVGRVKEIPSGDSKALAELLDELWEVEGEVEGMARRKGEDDDDHVQTEEKSERIASLFATTALARVSGCFMPPSSDVLSSIVTAVSAPGIDSALEELTVRRLIATQHSLKKAFQQQQRNAAKRNSSGDASASGTGSAWSGVALRAPQLPRRALRLIEKYAQKERQVALTKRIDSMKGNKHEKVE